MTGVCDISQGGCDVNWFGPSCSGNKIIIEYIGILFNDKKCSYCITIILPKSIHRIKNMLNWVTDMTYIIDLLKGTSI